MNKEKGNSMKVTVSTDVELKTEDDWIAFNKEIEAIVLLKAYSLNINPALYIESKSRAFIESMYVAVDVGGRTHDEIGDRLKRLLSDEVDLFLKNVEDKKKDGPHI